MRITKLLLPSLLASLSACATDDDPPSTSSTESALTYNTLLYHTCDSTHTTACDELKVGETKSDVCVLAGLRGDFHKTRSESNYPGAEVRIEGGSWMLRWERTNTNPGNMTAAVECWKGDGNHTTVLGLNTPEGFPSTVTTSRTAHCFLTGVYSMSANGFTDLGDTVQVHKTSSTTWQLDAASADGSMYLAYARCVDGPADVTTYSHSNTGGSPFETNILSPGNNAACASTMIGGVLNPGYEVGVYANWRESPNTFFIHEDGKTQGSWNCIR